MSKSVLRTAYALLIVSIIGLAYAACKLIDSTGRGSTIVYTDDSGLEVVRFWDEYGRHYVARHKLTDDVSIVE